MYAPLIAIPTLAEKSRVPFKTGTTISFANLSVSQTKTLEAYANEKPRKSISSEVFHLTKPYMI